jgi:hypothetical protein
MSRPSAETQRLPDLADSCGSSECYGVSQDPSFAARNSASMTRMFADGVLEREFERSLAEDGARERVALQSEPGGGLARLGGIA